MGYLKASFQVFMRYRYLLLNLVNRDIKVKYRRSVLGLLWSILNPLLMMLVMALVFSTLFNRMMSEGMPLVTATGQPPAFLVYLLSGQLVFNYFKEATSLAMDSVLGNAALVRKVYIPKYIFPLEKVGFSTINMLFSLLALVLVMAFTRSPISWWILLVPVMLGLLFLFNLGVGLVFSCMVVFFRDISHLYGVLMMALSYLTPIFYTENILKGYSLATYVMKVNPMYWYVSMFRDLVVYGRAPDVRTWFACTACALVAVVVGLLVFRRHQDNFILHM